MSLSETCDDGGLSGGLLERPALQKMLEHIGDRRMDQIVVYRIDRLTRSLADFARIVDIPDAAKASFVSVTRSFNTATGNVSGGGFFDRGHIYHILTNPVFAGRIRHRKVVHDGLHEAIIDPGRRDRIQVQLQDGASRSRSKAGTNQKSPLRGKLFDETGDRLTPSHTKTRKGVRLRHYIFHRPVTRRRDAHPDAWRLPAREPETKSAAAIRRMLTDNAFAAWIVPDGRVDEIARVRSRLVDKIEIAPGDMRVSLNGTMLADMPGIGTDAIGDGLLSQNVPFQLRKRGVETRLILADGPTGIDATLIRNIAKANVWFEHLKAGKSSAELAKDNDTSPRRIQQIIELAFLAPDIVRDVLEGKQPLGFTSKWHSRHSLPSDWSEQRQLLTTL